MTSQELNGFDLMLSRAISQLDKPITDTEQSNNIVSKKPDSLNNNEQEIDHIHPPEPNGSNNQGQQPEATRRNKNTHDKSKKVIECILDKVTGHHYNRHGTLRIKMSKNGYDYVAVLSLNEALENNKTVVCQYLRQLNTKARNNLVRRHPDALNCLKTEGQDNKSHQD